MSDDSPYRLAVAGPAARDIEQLPTKYAAAVVEALDAIAANPQRLGKPLRFELEGRWSVRRGPYRVVYSIDEGKRLVPVLAIAHRAHVYRRS